MKCPNCGYEMSDEHLYCEKCGNEIQIVPDFEPELENSITETLSTVGEEIEGRVDTEKPLTSPKSSGHSSKTTSGKNSMVACLVIFVIVVLLTIFSGVFLYQRYSVNYQISRAGKYAERGKYAEAASYLERALKLEPGQTNVVLALANDYYLCGEKQKALELLLKHIDTVVLETEEKEVVYEKIIALYEEEERYEEINSLLLKCENVEVQTRFQQYMAMTPEFNYIAGSYDKIIPLKISVNTTGTIYYTLDGSDPDENSMIYTSPIFLESGE